MPGRRTQPADFGAEGETVVDEIRQETMVGWNFDLDGREQELFQFE